MAQKQSNGKSSKTKPKKSAAASAKKTDKKKSVKNKVTAKKAEKKAIKKSAVSKPAVVSFEQVQIGAQVWMKQNLDVDRFRDGTPIPEVRDDAAWQAAGVAGQPAWCYYNNDPANGAKYGKLYNWYAVSDPRGLCPAGWQIASDVDWTELAEQLGGPEVAAIKMKSSSGWENHEGLSGNGNNDSDFSGLPGGSRFCAGRFSGIGREGYWWTASEFDSSDGWIRFLDQKNSTLNGDYNYSSKCDGFYVRCLRTRPIQKKVAEKKAVKKSAAPKPAVKNLKEVQIGAQVWMTRNLDVDKFRDGTPIPEVRDAAEWKAAGESRQPAWCYYDNDPANGAKYGKLYNWFAVSDPRGLCPEGWHVPTDDQWTLLTDHLESQGEAGHKMKSDSGWDDYEWKPGNGNNESGFSGLPGGFRYYDGDFSSVGCFGQWWTSSEANSANAWIYYLEYGDGDVTKNHGDKENGFSVRCIKD